MTFIAGLILAVLTSVAIAAAICLAFGITSLALTMPIGAAVGWIVVGEFGKRVS